MKRIEELKKEYDELCKKQMKEYRTRGNTQYSQELFEKIQKLESEINALKK